MNYASRFIQNFNGFCTMLLRVNGLFVNTMGMNKLADTDHEAIRTSIISKFEKITWII